MDVKKVKNIIYIAFAILFISTCIFAGGYWTAVKRTAVEYEKRSVEIDKHLQQLATEDYQMGESISRNLTTVELIERIQQEARKAREAERRETERRIAEIRKGLIAGKGTLKGVRDNTGAVTEGLESLADRLQQAAKAAEKYEILLDRNGVSDSD